MARQHGVTPLLYYHLKQLGIALPGDLTEELQQAFLVNAARNIHLYQELGKLLQRLREQGIAVIALKGAHLAEAVYDNIGLRIMGDIDLLVRKDNLLRVEQELLALGYKPEECSRVIAQDNYQFSYTQPKNGFIVEIHWLLVASQPTFQVGMEDLWSRAQPLMLAQDPVWTLSPADLLLFLCLHTAKHTHDIQLKMLCDIGEVVQRYEAELDWQVIGARARQWGITHAVYLILRLAQELLEVAVPEDWLASLQPASFDKRYLSLTRQIILATRMDAPMAQHRQVIRLWGPKGFCGKIAIIRDSLLLSRERMATLYPVPVNSWRIYLYYPVRIKDVLVRHGATLWRLARSDPKARAAAERINQVTALLDWLMSK